MKRIFDLVFGSILLIITLPLMLLFSIILYFEFKAFPIFKQERGLTIEKYRFNILKLRTIKPEGEEIAHKTEADIFLKPQLKDRTSRFARWLRKSALDELPQLINVIKGEMSIIGPRPLMLRDLETMKEHTPELYRKRGELKYKPGISGLWQLFGNRSEGAIGLVALDSLYEKSASFIFDFKLMLYTSSIIISAKNSDSIFYTPRSTSHRSRTIVDSSSNLKVTLNMPEGIANFILEKVEKHEGKYTVQIPSDWWYASDTYKTVIENKKKNKSRIFPINSTFNNSKKKNAS
jgi:lipopolysaccharide/colanic/teichoic acid biosynthesis glycosyltransferase